MIQLRRALEEDSALLTELSRRSFDADVHYGAPGPGGPPGYDDAAWQRRVIAAVDYYVISLDGAPIGGIIAYATAPGEYEMGRIFIAPEWQNCGLGSEALALLWPLYPQARVWRLDTPAWNLRTRRFYTREGFGETGVTDDGQVLLQRPVSPAEGPCHTEGRGE
jgi:GNAT superfamily N-acetyltransferase